MLKKEELQRGCWYVVIDEDVNCWLVEWNGKLFNGVDKGVDSNTEKTFSYDALISIQPTILDVAQRPEPTETDFCYCRMLTE